VQQFDCYGGVGRSYIHEISMSILSWNLVEVLVVGIVHFKWRHIGLVGI
jgi:hypothetical protein